MNGYPKTTDGFQHANISKSHLQYPYANSRTLLRLHSLAWRVFACAELTEKHCPTNRLGLARLCARTCYSNHFQPIHPNYPACARAVMDRRDASISWHRGHLVEVRWRLELL